MKKDKNTLLVLDETERSMIIESLHNYIYHYFGVNIVDKNSDKHRIDMIDVLEKIKAQTGGFRMVTTEENIYLIVLALRWNSKFTLSEKDRNHMEEMDQYTDLSYILDGRNKNLYLFKDFNPKEYSLNAKLKPFPKFDFTQKRIFMIRFEKEYMEYITEFYRLENETDEQYTKRAEEEVIKKDQEVVKNVQYNKIFLDMKYKAVTFDEVKNYKLKKGFSYHQ